MKYFLLVLCLCCFSKQSTAQLSASNLPIIVINTHGQDIIDDPKIIADMGIVWNGDGSVNNITDAFNHYNGKIGIEIRGQSSQMFPMKSYSIELWNADSSSLSKSLFGFPSESDWVLYAPYNDKTLMHNFLAYTISREMGHWAARCRYVEVVINGDYKGIYVFMEKIKRKSGRVNISSMGSSDNSGDAVTGGYIFSIDKEPNGWFSLYGAGNHNIQYSYIYPKVTSVTDAQKTYIKTYVDSFENAMYSSAYQDKSTGWRRFADELSFIDYFIVNELSRNVDGYRLSTYLYKDRQSKGGKIIAGPVWDYDLAFRNANYCSGSDVNGWSYQFNNICPDDYWQVPFWWNKLLKDSAFQGNLRCRWKTVRAGSLSAARLNQLVDSVVNLTATARTRHFARWPVLGQYVWPNPQPIPSDYAGEIQTMKTWIAQRLQWIDENIPNKGACADYPAGVSTSFIITSFPNPLNGISITIQSKMNQVLKIRVIDMLGRLMYQSTAALNVGFNNITLPQTNWSNGICFVEFTGSNGEKITKRILK